MKVYKHILIMYDKQTLKGFSLTNKERRDNNNIFCHVLNCPVKNYIFLNTGRFNSYIDYVRDDKLIIHLNETEI